MANNTAVPVDREIVVPAIRVGDFVRVTNIFTNNERGKVEGGIPGGGVAVRFNGGRLRGVLPDRMVRDDDQTTPLDSATTDQPTQ